MSDLHEQLNALGADARWPATPDLAPGVRAAVAADAVPARRPGRLPGALVRPPAGVLAAALLVLAVAGLLVAAPGVRSALLRTLGLEHAQVTGVERLPPTTLGTRLDLGERTTLADARRRAGFALRAPVALGTAQEVYVDRGAVTFVYGARSGRLVLLQQVRGSAGPYVRKFARQVERVDVAGAPGLLVTGAHVTVFHQRPGALREEPSRLAKSTLLWERDGLLLRLEADLARKELLAIARSVR